jgi:hypothetical protein
MIVRPRSVTIISWLFIVVGGVGLLYHFSEVIGRHRLDYELVEVCFVRLMAIVAGVFMLRGCNWARWLLVLWMAYHIVLSAFHSPLECALHCLLFGGVAYFLFRPRVSAYFRAATGA